MLLHIFLKLIFEVWSFILHFKLLIKFDHLYFTLSYFCGLILYTTLELTFEVWTLWLLHQWWRILLGVLSPAQLEAKTRKDLENFWCPKSNGSSPRRDLKVTFNIIVWHETLQESLENSVSQPFSHHNKHKWLVKSFC